VAIIAPRGEYPEVRPFALVAVALGGEHVTESPEGADDLVGDQQHVVLVADLAHPLEVAGRGREAAAGVLHGLEEDGRDGLGPLELDRLGDAVGRPLAEGVLVVGAEVGGLGGAVEVRVRHPEGRGHQWLERRLHARQAGDRQGALRSAVVGDRAADHLVLGRLAGELEVVLGQLPRGLDSLATAGGEEDAVEVTGGVVGDALGQVDRTRVRVGPEREEGELRGLLGGGLGELGATVPCLYDEQAGEPVDVLVAVGVPDVDAVASHDRGDLVLVIGGVPGEVHPEVVLGSLLATLFGLGIGHDSYTSVISTPWRPQSALPIVV
jgi:hypothetical protein